MNCHTCHQVIGAPLHGELNPNHPVTAETRELWHKLFAVWMFKQGINEVKITSADVDLALGESSGINIVMIPKGDAITVRLVSDLEARRLVQEEGGMPA